MISTKEDAYKVLTVALFTPGKDAGSWGNAMLAWGLPGVGKTAIISEFCRDHGLPLYVMSPGEMGEAAFGVVPVPEGAGANMTLRFPPPGDIVDTFQGGRGAIFVDELTTAPKAAKPGLLSLLLEKRLGGYYFGNGVRVIAAANDANIAAAGTDLSIPEANRLTHINWAVKDMDAWLQHMMGNLVGAVPTTPKDAQSIEDFVMSHWNDVYPQWVAKVYGFLKAPSNSAVIHKLPDKGADRTRAWASQRSWSALARIAAGCEIHNIGAELTDGLFAGTVGGQVAGAFSAFLNDKDLPDAVEVLTGKVKWVPSHKRPDIAWVVCQGMAAHVIAKTKAAGSDKNKNEEAKDLLASFIQLTMGWNSFREITALTGKTILEGQIRIGETAEGRKWMTEHRQVITDAQAIKQAR